jgi:serine/threonine-protein kinase
LFSSSCDAFVSGELLRELGGGGFGLVYLARDTVAGVDVAVKGLPPMVRNNAEELERIRENFALVSKLHHPHIAAALHLHPAKEVSYTDEPTRQKLRVLQGDTLMVMAYASGVTLTKWRKQFPEGKVPVEQALEVCNQVAEALDYAHREKVAHRDVKPSNIMVETREQGSGDRGQGSGGPGGSSVA